MVTPLPPAGHHHSATTSRARKQTQLRSGAALARTALAKGLAVRVTCTRDARATLSLRLAKRVAKRLGLKAPAAGLVVATGGGNCRAGVPLSVKLIFKKAFRARLARRGATVPATLVVALVATDGTRGASTLGVKLR